uniref:Glycosyl alpha-2 n=1 Tax=Jatropha curcas TaxID=180498 RepID=E2CXH3_JATCU|nr:glycosyl alpha-2 [Jatropha curcas]
MKILQFGLLIALASGISAILICVTGVSNLNSVHKLSRDDVEALESLLSTFQKVQMD